MIQLKVCRYAGDGEPMMFSEHQNFEKNKNMIIANSD